MPSMAWIVFGGWTERFQDVLTFFGSVTLAFRGLALGKLKFRNEWLYIVRYSLERGRYRIINVASRSVQQLDCNSLGECPKDLYPRMLRDVNCKYTVLKKLDIFHFSYLSQVFLQFSLLSSLSQLIQPL